MIIWNILESKNFEEYLRQPSLKNIRPSIPSEKKNKFSPQDQKDWHPCIRVLRGSFTIFPRNILYQHPQIPNKIPNSLLPRAYNPFRTIHARIAVSNANKMAYKSSPPNYPLACVSLSADSLRSRKIPIGFRNSSSRTDPNSVYSLEHRA